LTLVGRNPAFSLGHHPLPGANNPNWPVWSIFKGMHNGGAGMDISTSISISVGCISVIMLLASWLFQDRPGAKPARLAFRVFYVATLMVFILIMAEAQWENPLILLATDLVLAISACSLLLGVLWRCKSPIPNYAVYMLGLAFVLVDTVLMPGSLVPGHTLEVVCSAIAIAALLRRRPHRNGGDIGMALVLLVWAAAFLKELSGGYGITSYDDYHVEDSLIMLIAPAYISGLTLFLISSYMLDAQHDLALLASTDPMTGLHNRRYFLDESQKILKSANRYQYPISVIMCDIDNFKQVNDKHGHDTGDKVIKAFAACLQRMIRGDDILARYGGEEFMILLPQANDLAAMLAAERMREEAEVLRIRGHRETLRFTASFGVCQITDFNDIQISVSEADTAMYQAKNSGRNRVCLYESQEGLS